MVWCVVHFVLDDTVEVVPGSWYRKDGNCAWPKTTKISEIKKAVFNKVRPNKQDFSFYEARCLASNIDNFSKAQNKCSLAKCKSDLSSMEDDNLKKRKKIIRKIKAHSSSSESDGEQSDSFTVKNSIPCYHSDSESQPKKNFRTSQMNSIERRPNGWSPLKISVIDTEAENIPFSDICSEKTVLKSNTSTFSPIKLSNEASTSSFSEKKSPKLNKIDQSLSTVNLSRLSPSSGVKRSLFSDINKQHTSSNSPDFNETLKTSAIKTPRNKSSTSTSKNLKYGDQFKDMVLHNLLIIKHSIRNLDEKLNLIIDKTSRNVDTSNLSEDDVDYSNLNCLFPIEDISTLNDIEEQLALDTKYHKSLTNKLIGLGGKTVKIYIKRVMQLLFSDDLLKSYSFNGRGNKKRCFSNLTISKLIFGSIKVLKKFSYDNAHDDAEKYIKNALIQAPFNIKKKMSNTAANTTD